MFDWWPTVFWKLQDGSRFSLILTKRLVECWLSMIFLEVEKSNSEQERAIGIICEAWIQNRKVAHKIFQQ